MTPARSWPFIGRTVPSKACKSQESRRAREKRLDVVQALAAARLDAGLLVRALRSLRDSRNLVIEDLVGQSVGGNAVAELAAGVLLGLEDSNRMAFSAAR